MAGAAPPSRLVVTPGSAPDAGAVIVVIAARIRPRAPGRAGRDTVPTHKVVWSGGPGPPLRWGARRRRLRPVRHPRGADPRAARAGVDDLTVVSNNCGVDDLGLGVLLDKRQIAQDDQLVRRREQGVRAPVPGGRARGRADPAGHAGRAAARRRRRHPGVLHADRRRQSPIYRRGVAERKDCASSTATRVRARGGHPPDFALVQAWKGDRFGNLVFQVDGAQLQPARGDGRPDHHRRGRGARRAGRPRPRRRAPARASSCTASSWSAPRIEKRIERRTVRAGPHRG